MKNSSIKKCSYNHVVQNLEPYVMKYTRENIHLLTNKMKKYICRHCGKENIDYVMRYSVDMNGNLNTDMDGSIHGTFCSSCLYPKNHYS